MQRRTRSAAQAAQAKIDISLAQPPVADSNDQNAPRPQLRKSKTLAVPSAKASTSAKQQQTLKNFFARPVKDTPSELELVPDLPLVVSDAPVEVVDNVVDEDNNIPTGVIHEVQTAEPLQIPLESEPEQIIPIEISSPPVKSQLDASALEHELITHPHGPPHPEPPRIIPIEISSSPLAPLLRVSAQPVIQVPPPPPKKLFSIFQASQPRQEHTTSSSPLPASDYIAVSSPSSPPSTRISTEPSEHNASTPPPITRPSSTLPSSSSHYVPIEIDSDEDFTAPGSQQAPIEIFDASPPPVQLRQAPAPRQFHPLFNRKPKPAPSVPRPIAISSVPQKNGESSKTLPTPLPTKDEQHIQCLQAMFVPSSPTLTPRKRKRVSPPTSRHIPEHLRGSDGVEIPPQGLRTCTEFDEEDMEKYLRDISPNLLAHPAIKKLENNFLSDLADESHQGELWAEKWRPRGPNEILGNEGHASYLKAWLRALEVEIHGTDASRTRKRPVVVRTVTKMKGRPRKRQKNSDWDASSLDGFITDTSEPEDVPLGGDDDDFELPPSSPVRRRQRAAELTSQQPLSPRSAAMEQYGFSNQLTNTILISGPSGCGKTASVYACAEEGGWQVFEVYPGIAKRTGANITALVGDLAKNHTITKVGTKGSSQIFSSPTKPKNSALPTLDTNLDDRRGKEGGFAQSIILFEEVDILFNEDANFWPAVIRLIRESRRPVVLTCNDPTILPLEDLPIQAHLQFEACAQPLACAYLRCLALAEGHLLLPRDAEALYNQGSAVRYETEYESSRSLRREAPDLRRALHQLQLWCSGGAKLRDILAPGGPHEGSLTFDWTRPISVQARDDGILERVGHLRDSYDLHQLCRFSESASFLDSHLSRQLLDVECLTTYDGTDGSFPDTELGHTKVAIDEKWGRSNVLRFYGKEADMRVASCERSRELLERAGSGNRARSQIRGGQVGIWDERRLLMAQAQYRADVALAVERVVPGWTGGRWTGSAIFTGLVAWLRHVETEEHEQPRVTRRGGRGGLEKMVI